MSRPTGRPDSIVSDISEDTPDTAQRGRDYVPSISSDQSYPYQQRSGSPSQNSLYKDGGEEKAKFISPSQASENGDATLSEVASAYKNHAILTGEDQAAGSRTPKTFERGEVTSEVIEGLQDEIERLTKLVEEETSKREQITDQFKKWKEMMTHNTKAYIQNSKVNLHKNYMRIHPILNDEGDYPDMVVFPNTVGALMKMNEAHLTRLVVFYGLQTDSGMDYYAKYCALRDHLGIEP
ncbi:hypothetical protein ABW19_dt0202961 [Dactylella cylindrospora]|nr:hypothetical protein ABW19_dt0202961 [Dactylella cylindrospora]